MTNGMEILARVWDNRDGPAVLATVDAAKKPNVIYVGEIWFDAREGFIIADNYFCKTRANIKDGTMGAVLFITKDRKSFQAKGTITYHTEGPVFESMRARHDPKRPGVAAAQLRVEEAYSGAERLL
jgi:predicted pyridoxine 5'-phosphate oxidase superfamily flavin-nucleotide-binding protein